MSTIEETIDFLDEINPASDEGRRVISQVFSGDTPTLEIIKKIVKRLKITIDEKTEPQLKNHILSWVPSKRRNVLWKIENTLNLVGYCKNLVLIYSILCKCSADVIRYLLKTDIDINAENVELIILYSDDYSEEELLEMFDNFKENKKIFTPLAYALSFGDFDIIKLIIDNGADINNGAMKLAVLFNKIVVIEYLIKQGAKIRKYDHKNATMSVAKILIKNTSEDELNNDYILNLYIERKASIEVLSLLIEKGVDVNKQDVEFSAPIFHAINVGNLDVIKLLLDNGTDINLVNKKGETPLIYAIKTRKNDAIVLYLIENGADVNKEDKFRHTPLMYAIEFNYSLSVIHAIAKMDLLISNSIGYVKFIIGHILEQKNVDYVVSLLDCLNNYIISYQIIGKGNIDLLFRTFDYNIPKEIVYAMMKNKVDPNMLYTNKPIYKGFKQLSNYYLKLYESIAENRKYIQHVNQTQKEEIIKTLKDNGMKMVMKHISYNIFRNFVGGRSNYLKREYVEYCLHHFPYKDYNTLRFLIYVLCEKFDCSIDEIFLKYGIDTNLKTKSGNLLIDAYSWKHDFKASDLCKSEVVIPEKLSPDCLLIMLRYTKIKDHNIPSRALRSIPIDFVFLRYKIAPTVNIWGEALIPAISELKKTEVYKTESGNTIDHFI